MGNYEVTFNRKQMSEEQKFKEAVREIRSENSTPTTSKLVTNQDTKYRQHMLQALQKTNFSADFKSTLESIIKSKITKQELMETICAIKPLKNNSLITNNSVLDSVFKQSLEDSKRVVVRFDMTIAEKKKKSMVEGESVFLHKERTTEGRLSRVEIFLKSQLNSKYHPFGKLCKGLAKLIYQLDFGPSETEKELQVKIQELSKLIKIFSHFIIQGCLFPYEKWIISYTSMTKQKYTKWAYHLIINKIWVVNESSLHRVMTSLLSTIKIPLKLEQEICQLKPADFHIDEKFQIEGNYFQAIFQTSELTSESEPSKILKQLEIMKISICRDIDNFHSLQADGNFYEVDSDNIMGIITYLLCRVGKKIQEIQIQLLVLLLVYGDRVYFEMGISSYMYSTIVGGKEYLQKNYKINGGKFQESKTTDYNSLKI